LRHNQIVIDGELTGQSGAGGEVDPLVNERANSADSVFTTRGRRAPVEDHRQDDRSSPQGGRFEEDPLPLPQTARVSRAFLHCADEAGSSFWAPACRRGPAAAAVGRGLSQPGSHRRPIAADDDGSAAGR
jgi:hypothetical protein